MFGEGEEGGQDLFEKLRKAIRKRAGNRLVQGVSRAAGTSKCAGVKGEGKRMLRDIGSMGD